MADLARRLDADPSLRLAAVLHRDAYGGEPAGVWSAPGAVTLLGGGARALAVAARPGAALAAAPRDDDRLELRSLSHPAERVAARVGELVPGAGPPWAAGALAAAWALRAAGPALRGATVALALEVPEGTGLGAPAAAAGATALALSDLHGLAAPSAALAGAALRGLAAWGRAHLGTSAAAASPLGRAAHATLGDGAGAFTPLPWDLAAADLRLLVVDTRVRRAPPAPAPAGWEERERALVRAGVALLERGDAAGLGPLLTRAHEALRAAGAGGPEQEVAVRAALEAGALGARMTWEHPGGPVVALVAAGQLARVRAALSREFTRHGWPVPRSLSTVPADGASRVG